MNGGGVKSVGDGLAVVRVRRLASCALGHGRYFVSLPNYIRHRAPRNKEASHDCIADDDRHHWPDRPHGIGRAEVHRLLPGPGWAASALSGTAIPRVLRLWRHSPDALAPGKGLQ